MKMTGNRFLVEALKKEGVEYVFGYQGACVMDIFDELYKQDEIEVVLPRHEQGLAHAADGYARATGKVGVCLVTSGPGAANLVSGIANANYDSIPLVCFTGQVPRYHIGNDAFQEVDIIGITRSICKYGVTVRDRKELGKVIKEAFYIARTGKPGPVVIDLPKDVMQEVDDTPYPEEVNLRGYKPVTDVHIGQIKRAVRELSKAKKPLFLAGGGVNLARAQKEFQQLVELTGVPVVTTIMGKGSIPTEHPLYVGNLGMHGCYAANMAVSECDLLFSIGTRFNDRITGKIQDFASDATIIHIDIDTSAISRNIQVDIPIVADAKQAIEKLLEYAKPGNEKVLGQWAEHVHKRSEEDPVIAVQDKPGLNPYRILDTINKEFDDAIVVTDVGQHQMWTTQFLQMDANKQLLTSGGLGIMGFGFPAAIGAKLGYRDRDVICISGDGGMQMNIQELATAVTEKLPIIICIMNNGYLGMVRQWQQLFYKRRYASTNLMKNPDGLVKQPDGSLVYSPDFVRLAQSYGAYGIRVTDEAGISEAFTAARNNTDAPTVIEFIIDEEELVLPMVKGGSALTEMIL